MLSCAGSAPAIDRQLLTNEGPTPAAAAATKSTENERGRERQRVEREKSPTRGREAPRVEGQASLSVTEGSLEQVDSVFHRFKAFDHICLFVCAPVILGMQLTGVVLVLSSGLMMLLLLLVV